MEIFIDNARTARLVDDNEIASGAALAVRYVCDASLECRGGRCAGALPVRVGVHCLGRSGACDDERAEARAINRAPRRWVCSSFWRKPQP